MSTTRSKPASGTGKRKKAVAIPASTKSGRKSNGENIEATMIFGGIQPYTQKKGEAYMGEEQKEHFCRILMAWHDELMKEVDRTVHHMRDEASNFPDPNDRASQESEFSLELRTRDRERKLLRKIDETLRNLEINEYGWCENCGGEIGIRRLEARPTATLCIDCKTLDEIRERQSGG